MQNSERGVALVLVLVVLVIISTMVAALVTDVVRDHFITRNLRLQREAQNWGESGQDMTQEVIVHAGNTRGGDANATFPLTVGGKTFSVSNPGGTLFWNNGTVLLQDPEGKTLANSRVEFLGMQRQEGNSIIIAAGYEGVGKGAGSGGAMAMIYSIETHSNSTAPGSNAHQRMAEIYRFAFGGL